MSGDLATMRSLLLSAGLSAAVGAMLSALILAANPHAYQLLSDSISWRIGTMPARQHNLEATLQAIHLRGDSLVNDNSILLFGDSHLHSLPTSLIEGSAVNYAIAGETAERLAKRLPSYKSLNRVKKIVLLAGRNDLAQGRPPDTVAFFVRSALEQIPNKTTVVLVGIPPLLKQHDANRLTQETNRLLENLCLERAGCLFLDLKMLSDKYGSLREDYVIADGIHLSTAGYAEFATRLNHALHLPPQ